MINLFETSRGDFVPASSLTAEEAVDLHRRGVLGAVDARRLSPAARIAVDVVVAGRVGSRRRRGGCGVTIFWGVRTPTRAHQGRA